MSDGPTLFDHVPSNTAQVIYESRTHATFGEYPASTVRLSEPATEMLGTPRPVRRPTPFVLSTPPPIDLPAEAHPEPPPGSIGEAFDLFHEANPWVYDHLVQLARDLRARGRRKIGIGMLTEILRWSYLMQTDDPTSDWKINNNYRSRYARKIMEENPSLAGIFETRELKAP